MLILITRYPTKTMYSSVDGLIGKIFVFLIILKIHELLEENLNIRLLQKQLVVKIVFVMRDDVYHELMILVLV